MTPTRSAQLRVGSDDADPAVAGGYEDRGFFYDIPVLIFDCLLILAFGTLPLWLGLLANVVQR